MFLSENTLYTFPQERNWFAVMFFKKAPEQVILLQKKASGHVYFQSQKKSTRQGAFCDWQCKICDCRLMPYYIATSYDCLNALHVTVETKLKISVTISVASFYAQSVYKKWMSHLLYTCYIFVSTLYIYFKWFKEIVYPNMYVHRMFMLFQNKFLSSVKHKRKILKNASNQTVDCSHYIYIQTMELNGYHQLFEFLGKLSIYILPWRIIVVKIIPSINVQPGINKQTTKEMWPNNSLQSPTSPQDICLVSSRLTQNQKTGS